MLLSPAVRWKDFADDRLASGLRYLSDDETWETIEQELSQRLIRVYDLTPGPMRLDSTAAAVYHDTEGSTVFQHGHSKDHRPDLAQFKVMLATLDPLGMPLATLVVPGNENDDGLYIPTIRRTREIVGQGKRLYIGDSKHGRPRTLGADGPLIAVGEGVPINGFRCDGSIPCSVTSPSIAHCPTQKSGDETT